MPSRGEVWLVDLGMAEAENLERGMEE